MIEALARFAEALRAEGVSASPAELVDAARAVESLDLGNRSRIKAALRATLAKDRKQAATFDKVFDGFFLPPPPVPGEGKGKRRGAGASSEPRSRRSAREQQGALRPGPVSPSREPKRGKGPSRSEADEALRSKGRDPSETLLERIRSNRPAKRERMRVLLAEEQTRRAPVAPAAPSSDPAARSTLTRSLSRQEETELARQIPRLVQQIRLRRARRLTSSRRGRIWPARVFRANLVSGGVPFVLPFRRRRRRKSRVVLLVDVSWSVARAAGFFLWIASEFLRVGRNTRVLAFVDRPADATEAVRRWGRRGHAAAGDAHRAAPARRADRGRRVSPPASGIVRGGVSFADVVGNLRELNPDAPSDYGRAFHGVLRERNQTGGRDTVLVVLGDGRTNRFDPLPWTLDEIARRCRAVIWLVPEPAARWGTGDSRLADYLSCVDVLVEAHDLNGIARGVGEILRRV